MALIKALERISAQQSNEDAKEILQILVTFDDYRISRYLRQQLAAIKKRAERIVRNTEVP